MHARWLSRCDALGQGRTEFPSCFSPLLPPSAPRQGAEANQGAPLFSYHTGYSTVVEPEPVFCGMVLLWHAASPRYGGRPAYSPDMVDLRGIYLAFDLIVLDLDILYYFLDDFNFIGRNQTSVRVPRTLIP